MSGILRTLYSIHFKILNVSVSLTGNEYSLQINYFYPNFASISVVEMFSLVRLIDKLIGFSNVSKPRYLKV